MTGFDRAAARGVFAGRLPSGPAWAAWIEGTLDELDGCVQPADGIVVSREEAALAREAVLYWVMIRDSQGLPNLDRFRDLASRLEASS